MRLAGLKRTAPIVLMTMLACVSKDNCLNDLPEDQGRNAQWAVRLTRPGLQNLHRVNKKLYRGTQPTNEGFLELKKLGIRTVISLRSFKSDRDEIGDHYFQYEHIYMKASKK